MWKEVCDKGEFGARVAICRVLSLPLEPFSGAPKYFWQQAFTARYPQVTDGCALFPCP